MGDAYKSGPEAVVDKAFNLEKFLGADKAGRGVIIPKADAKPEEWRAFYAKVGGVPEKPEGYKIPDALAKDPIIAKLRERAHALGVPPALFGGVLETFAAESAGLAERQATEFAATAQREVEALYAEWGATGEKDKNIELSRRAARTFIPHETPEQLAETLNKIEGAIGAAATLKLFASIGNGLGEHNFIQGDGNGGMGGMTPEAARMRINDLRNDAEFAKKLLNADADAKAEWDRLHKIGFPEPKKK
jgi:hypothetical protein